MNTGDSETGTETAWRHAAEVVLPTLLQAGNLERLETEAKRFLSQNPEDVSAHYFLALALIRLKRLPEAKRHLDHLLALEPDSVRSRLLAVCYHASMGNWTAVRKAAGEGLRQYPEDAFFHYYAALADLRQLRFKTARSHIDRARQLDPDDADIANLHIGIHGIGQETAADALRRLDRYRDALRLDPGNASLHHSMGIVALDELDDPRTAEQHFRGALRLEPMNRAIQADLFQAVAKRSLVYRLFSIPSRTFAWLRNLGKAVVAQPWRLVFLLFGFKLWIGFSAWVFITTLLLWPGGKAYEWLLVSEVRDGASLSRTGLRAWFWLRSWPSWSRFLLFLVLNLGMWGGLFWLVGVSLAAGYGTVGAFVGVHFLMVALLRGIKNAAAKRARRKRARSLGDERVTRLRD